MTLEAKRGKDTLIDSAGRVIVRVQGKQWRIDAPAGGVAVWPGEHSADLNYFGDRPISGAVWIGKTRHDLTIAP